MEIAIYFHKKIGDVVKIVRLCVQVICMCLLIFIACRLGYPSINSHDIILNHNENLSVFLAAQANQLALLQTFISVFGLSLGLIALWGYGAIKDGAKNTALATVKEAMKESVPTLIATTINEFTQEEYEKRNIKQQMKSEDKNPDLHIDKNVMYVDVITQMDENND